MIRPAIGQLPVRIAGTKGQRKARWNGQPMRCPKKGELYLSGAVPTAYEAPNDLLSEYFVAEEVV